MYLLFLSLESCIFLLQVNDFKLQLVCICLKNKRNKNPYTIFNTEENFIVNTRLFIFVSFHLIHMNSARGRRVRRDTFLFPSSGTSSRFSVLGHTLMPSVSSAIIRILASFLPKATKPRGFIKVGINGVIVQADNSCRRSKKRAVVSGWRRRWWCLIQRLVEEILEDGFIRVLVTQYWLMINV